jgi:hypothetical protein
MYAQNVATLITKQKKLELLEEGFLKYLTFKIKNLLLFRVQDAITPNFIKDQQVH